MIIGESFAEEIHAAGLGGLPFVWTKDEIVYSDSITRAEKTAIEAVLAAHDISTRRKDRRAERQGRIMGANNLAELKAVISDLT